MINGLILKLALDKIQIIQLIQHHQHLFRLLHHHLDIIRKHILENKHMLHHRLDIIRKEILENEHILHHHPIENQLKMIIMKTIHYLKM